MIRRILTAFGLTLAMLAGPPAAAGAADNGGETTKNRPTVTVWFQGPSEIRRAITLLRENRPGEAVNLAEVALSLDLKASDHRRALNVLCIGYVQAEDPRRALPHCDDLVALGEDDWQTYNNRANAYFALRRYDKALADYKRALKLTTAEETAQAEAEAVPSTEGDGSTILSESAIPNPAAVVRKNLALTRKVLESAEPL